MSISLVRVTPSNAAHSIPQVLRLIKALAAYEKAPDAVEATEQLLHNAFFGDEHGRSYCEGVLAWEGGQPGEDGARAVGMAVWFYTFSTWTGRGGLYLEDLFVEESHRGQGIAKRLFNYLGKEAEERKLPRMDWVVLDWNTPAKEVYRRMGAKHMAEWEMMRLTGEPLKRLAQ
ncbi:hypothetical protein JCM10207_004616 [Rhodosporidiobolus poonsookiae]